MKNFDDGEEYDVCKFVCLQLLGMVTAEDQQQEEAKKKQFYPQVLAAPGSPWQVS